MEDREKEKGAHGPRTIIILVNKTKVAMDEREVSGLEIKQAAVATPVPDVTIDFDLFHVHGKEHVPVLNEDMLKIHAEEKFLMLRPDHNS